MTVQQKALYDLACCWLACGGAVAEAGEHLLSEVTGAALPNA